MLAGRGPCCCMSLRTAGVLIGILEIVFWTTSMAVSGNIIALDLYLNYDNHDISKSTTDGFHESPILVNNDTDENGDESIEDEEEEETVIEIIMATHPLLVLNCVLSLIRVFNGCVLIFGILKANRVMVKCSFAVHTLVLILAISLLILGILKAGSSLRNILFYSASLGGSLYLLWVIFELIAEMKSEVIIPRIPKPEV